MFNMYIKTVLKFCQSFKVALVTYYDAQLFDFEAGLLAQIMTLHTLQALARDSWIIGAFESTAVSPSSTQVKLPGAHSPLDRWTKLLE